jgi:urease accessory protein
MFDAISPSDLERDGADVAARLSPVRARGHVRLAFEARGGRTIARQIREAENYRVRMPAVGGRCEAVLINTGGGMAGGDRLVVDVAVAENAAAVVTSQAAERVYRSLGPETAVDVTLHLGPGARLAWLPQETLLYSGARLRRTLGAQLDPGASLLAAEMAVFGRTAMGERLGAGLLSDNWRIVREERLAFAEAVRLEGKLGDLLDRAAIAGGAGAIGILIYIARDAEDRLAEVRTALAATPASAAASAWEGKLIVRALAQTNTAVRTGIAAAARTLMGAAMPRVWQA